MYITAIALSFSDIIILQAGAIVLGVAVHFFLVSRKALRQTMPPEKKKKPLAVTNEIFDFPDTLPFTSLSGTQKAKKEKSIVPEEAMPIFAPAKSSAPKENVIDSFKETVLQQQRSLDSFLQNIESLQSEECLQLKKENTELKKSISRLEAMLEESEAELEGIKQQAAIAQKMTSRIEEVYKEFGFMQDKMAQLEKQSREANILALELEDTKQLYQQSQNELIRKQTKLEEIISENQRLHDLLSETEDKLTEANFQRQQMSKKTQLMQDMNEDMQQMANANKKLQTELRRIGELESMLNTMEEERPHLFRRNHL